MKTPRYPALYQSQCFVRLPFADLAGNSWRFEDKLGLAVCDRDGDDLELRGLFQDMLPWQAVAFSWTRLG